MEANLEIKNATVEGNKIKDIEFYGDWEVEVGGGSGEKIYRPVYDEKVPFGRDIIPYHVTPTTAVTSGRTQYGFSFGTEDDQNPFKYEVRVRGPSAGSLTYVSKGKSVVTWQKVSNPSIRNKFRVYFFTEDFSKCLGFTAVKWE